MIHDIASPGTRRAGGTEEAAEAEKADEASTAETTTAAQAQASVGYQDHSLSLGREWFALRVASVPRRPAPPASSFARSLPWGRPQAVSKGRARPPLDLTF